jgi:hypothetical protein
MLYLDEKDSVWKLKNGDDGDETYVSVSIWCATVIDWFIDWLIYLFIDLMSISL